jgi:hypothetical protein
MRYYNVEQSEEKIENYYNKEEKKIKIKEKNNE